MKQSKFNLLFTTDDGKEMVFNSYSCCLIESDKDLAEVMDNLESIDYDTLNEEDKQYIDELKKGNFIIDNRFDEVKALEYNHSLGRYNNDALNLVIAPTLACNFKCPYCYESAKKGVMSEEIQSAVINWVAESSKMKKSIHVFWYGGEPLLAKNVIFDMSRKMIEVCEENGCEYTSGIVTNGYLLNEEVIKQLVDLKINNMQLTLDGPERIHNQRRILKAGGEPTFDRIIENAIIVKNYPIGLSFRVNVDKNNAEHFDEVLDVLNEKGLKDIPVYIGQVQAYTEACSSIAGYCLSNREFANTALDFSKTLLKRNGDHGGIVYPGAKSNFCCCDQINSFVIDPDGYTYKCWNEVGSPELAVGSFTESMTMKDSMIMNNLKYMTWSPFKHSDCLECKLLPICMGGCPYVGVKEQKPVCERWKYYLDKMLKLKYLSLQPSKNLFPI